MTQVDGVPLPEFLAQLRAARVQSFRRGPGGTLEITFEPVTFEPARAPRMAPETDPEKAAIHPLDAVLSPPAFVVPSTE